MTQSDPATGVAPAPAVGFAARLPSQAWETVGIVGSPQHAVWVWYKPATLPQGLFLRIPDDVYRNDPQQAAQLTIRRLLLSAGIDPTAVAMWYLYGVPYDAGCGMSPFLDAPIPFPAAGVDPNIAVYIHGQTVAMPAAGPQPMMLLPQPMPLQAMPMPYVAAAPVQRDADDDLSITEVFERIQADWHFAMETEQELKRTRKKLHDLLGRLKALNRDLTSQERQHADNQDKRDWRDARRGLRDAEMRVWSCIKDFDIGDTSSAGKRLYFEQIYKKYVEPRRPFDGLRQAQREFETYRKMVSTLQSSMYTSMSNAQTNGERKAERIIDRIQARIRDAQTKRNFLGVIAD
jgi:hypothetical protein